MRRATSDKGIPSIRGECKLQYIKWVEAKKRVTELVALWNAELQEQFPMREALFIQNSFKDSNVYHEGSFIALNDKGEAVGFIVSKLWQEGELGVSLGDSVAWIQVILVASDYRGKGVGTALLQKAEQALREAGATRFILGRDPWHYFPGIPEQDRQARRWFEQRGYQFSKTVTDLVRDERDELQEQDELDELDEQNEHNNQLEYNIKEALPQDEGVEYRLLRQEEQERFIRFLQQSFPGRWEYEAIKYFELGGTGREFVVLVQEEEIIGFCRINDPRSPIIAQNVYWAPLFQGSLGGLGPLGINRDHRKKGYGLNIVKAGIHFLQQRGIEHSVIDWTELIQFYGKLGYKSWKNYAQYEKQVE